MAIFFIALLVVILQITAVSYARIGTAIFDLQIITLAFFGLKKGLKLGLLLGVFFGIFSGLFSTNALWLNIFLYSLTGLAVGYIGRWFYKEQLSTFIVMVFCSMALIYFSHYFYQILSVQLELDMLSYASRLFLPAALYTVAVAIFLFHFLKEIKL